MHFRLLKVNYRHLLQKNLELKIYIITHYSKLELLNSLLSTEISCCFKPPKLENECIF